MKKTIKLTESQIQNVVKVLINEQHILQDQFISLVKRMKSNGYKLDDVVHLLKQKWHGSTISYGDYHEY